MAKYLSVWYRMFIVFAVLWTWTIGTLTLFYVLLSFPKEIEERLEKLRNIEYHLAEAKSEKERDKISYDIPADRKRQMERDLQRRIERDRKRRIEGGYKQLIYEYHKNRKNVIYLFPLYWLAPIGLVYGIGWCVGWIIRGFRKEN
jgi:hypothetical protein